jgi:hypothetical protein
VIGGLEAPLPDNLGRGLGELAEIRGEAGRAADREDKGELATEPPKGSEGRLNALVEVAHDPGT